MNQPAKPVAHYHLPGLFEFYELYRAFLPLVPGTSGIFLRLVRYRLHLRRPGGLPLGRRPGRVRGTLDPDEVLALTQEYGISARLTFSNSLLREEHLSDPKCNALCALFEKGGGASKRRDRPFGTAAAIFEKRPIPELYLVSSTTKVLTDFPSFRQELDREDFRYVVPDFRLNKDL